MSFPSDPKGPKGAGGGGTRHVCPDGQPVTGGQRLWLLGHGGHAPAPAQSDCVVGKRLRHWDSVGVGSGKRLRHCAIVGGVAAWGGNSASHWAWLGACFPQRAPMLLTVGLSMCAFGTKGASDLNFLDANPNPKIAMEEEAPTPQLMIVLDTLRALMVLEQNCEKSTVLLGGIPLSDHIENVSRVLFELKVGEKDTDAIDNDDLAILPFLNELVSS